jgi:predicted transcriptional regulator
MTQEEKDNIYNWLDEHINKDTSIIYSGIVSINYNILMKNFKDLLNKM